MPARPLFAALLLPLCLAASAWAQFKDPDPNGAKVGDASVQRWRSGIVIMASGGPCRGITGYAPMPMDWPEQQVKVVHEDISPHARVTYQTLDGGVQVMTVKIANLGAGEEAKAVLTYEVRRNAIVPPDKTDQFRIADTKKLDSKIRPYLLPSPLIESQNPKIRALAKEVGMDQKQDWEHVKAIYDLVRRKITYKNGPIKGALAALNDGTGDCEEMTSLFIAICRAAGIPARTVWVPGHCYPEFYLLDEKGAGHWFPCQAAGTECFGGIPELRPILQKGDNFRAPYNRREHQRYLAEHIVGTPTAGGGTPKVRFVRELVPQ